MSNAGARFEVDAELFRVLRRLPFVGAVLVPLAIGAVLTSGAEAWRAGMLLALLALLVLSLVLRVPRAWSTGLLGGILTLQIGVILATGGFQSAFIVVPLPLAIVAGVVLPPRSAVALAVPVALAILGLAAVDATGLAPWLEAPPIDRNPGPGGTVAGTWLFAAVLAVAVVAGTGTGAVLRRVLERSAFHRRRLALEARAVMEDRNQEILALSATLAHELKNPLTAIQGLSTLLARRAEPGSKEAEQLGVMIAEVRRMASILEDFLSFSRPVTALSAVDTCLGDLLAEVVLLHEATAAERRVRIVAAESRPVRARCDVRKTKQILVNLLQNALEAAPEHSTVRVGAKEEGQRAVLWVEDGGPGLDPSLRDRLFTPGVTTKPEGSGLGLTIARTLAEQHGGHLSLEDLPGGGSRATLVLPREAS